MMRTFAFIATVAAAAAQTAGNVEMCNDLALNVVQCVPGGSESMDSMYMNNQKPNGECCTAAMQFTEACGGRAAIFDAIARLPEFLPLSPVYSTQEQVSIASTILAMAAHNCPTKDVGTCRSWAAAWPTCLADATDAPRDTGNPCCGIHEEVIENCMGYGFETSYDDADDHFTPEEFEMYRMWNEAQSADILALEAASEETHDGCTRGTETTCHAGLNALNACMEYQGIIASDNYYGECCALASMVADICANRDIDMYMATMFGTDRSPVLLKQMETCNSDEEDSDVCSRTVPFVRHMEMAGDHYLVATYCTPQWPMCEYLGEINGSHMFKVDHFPFDSMVVTDPDCAEMNEHPIGRRLSTQKKSSAKTFKSLSF